jgi:hypothetical protein
MHSDRGEAPGAHKHRRESPPRSPRATPPRSCRTRRASPWATTRRRSAAPTCAWRAAARRGGTTRTALWPRCAGCTAAPPPAGPPCSARRRARTRTRGTRSTCTTSRQGSGQARVQHNRAVVQSTPQHAEAQGRLARAARAARRSADTSTALVRPQNGPPAALEGAVGLARGLGLAHPRANRFPSCSRVFWSTCWSS